MTNQYPTRLIGILLFGIIILISTQCLVADAGEGKSSPNVVVILADDLGFSDLGCYGGEIATPQLDRLAQGGLRFTQFYNTARCWPSRGALLTGYYPQQIRRDTVPGVTSGGQGVRPRWARLMPTMLRPLGYRTYHSGKWHVDGKPLQNGFDRSYDLDDQNRFFSPQSHLEDGEPLPKVKVDSGYYATTAIADHALKCLKDHSTNHSERPFFLYLCFTAPHFPLQALPEDIARYAGKYEAGWDVLRRSRVTRLHENGIVSSQLSMLERDVGPPYSFPEAMEKLGPGEVNRPLPWSELNEVQSRFQSTKMAIHAAMVDRMDREIGRVVEQLKQMNALDNTLLMFASDNGASAEIMVRGDGHDPQAAPGSAATHLCLGPGFSSLANTPFRRHKTWVHEGGISTPLVVHWPKGIAARGELRRTPAHLIDLLPTVLSATGANQFGPKDEVAAPKLPGQNLLPVFDHDQPLQRECLWWQHEGNRALRIDDWKIVAAGANAPWELYDLNADRIESNNLAEKNRERVGAMEQVWQRLFEEHRDWATRPD